MLTISQLAHMIERLAPHSIFPATPAELDEYLARFWADDAEDTLPPADAEGGDLFHRELWLLVARRVRELRQEHRERARAEAVSGLFQAAAAKAQAEKQQA